MCILVELFNERKHYFKIFSLPYIKIVVLTYSKLYKCGNIAMRLYMFDIYTTLQLGPKQSLTPEGFLLCEEVPIARTGTQTYAKHELPGVEAGSDGLITVIREPEQVFRAETIASFEGKSVTIGHTFVDPDNFRRYEVGHVQNVRQSPYESDLLIADLLIKDKYAIDKIQDEKDDTGRIIKPGTLREVSCGYDADYDVERPGVARQVNIIGNHVALVSRGRAGPRCSIQDEALMTTKTKQPTGLFRKLLNAVRSGDAALIQRTADEAEAEEQRIADEERAEEIRAKDEEIENLKKTVDELTETVEKLKAGDEDENDDKGEKTGDEEPTEEEKQKTADAMSDTVVRAEILAPGFKLPTSDSVMRLADVATVRRSVLASALKTADGAKVITPLLSGQTIDALPVEMVNTVFVAASEMAKQANNTRGIVRSITKDSGQRGVVPTPTELNKRYADHYATK